MTTYYTVKEHNLYAYNNLTKITYEFCDGKWDISPFTKWTLENTFDLNQISYEHAMKMTNGLSPDIKEKESYRS